MTENFDEFIATRAHKMVTFRTLGAVVNQLFDFLLQMKKTRDSQAAALEARVRALEDRPVGVKYTGTYETGHTYSLHEASTHKGSLWICKVPRTTSEPGDDPSAWTLAVKRGRDARDIPKESR